MGWDSIFEWESFIDTMGCLLTAFILGGLIGFERQYRQRTAGLKTNVLVAVGAAAFVLAAKHLYGPEGAIRVGAYVVSGIGFLGAGVIMREAGSIVGLNTAAILWCSSAVGMCVGFSLYQEAILVTFFVLAANFLLGNLVERLNQRPIDISDLEGVCAVYVIVPRQHGKEVMSLLKKELRERHFHLRRLDVFPFGNDEEKIMAVMGSASADSARLDATVDALAASPSVTQVFWSRGATG